MTKLLAIATSLLSALHFLTEAQRCFEGRTHEWDGIPGSLVIDDKSLVLEEFPKHFKHARSPYCEGRPQLHFVSPVCELIPFIPEKFLSVIRNRRLVLWGDSVTRQLFEFLRVHLIAYETPRDALTKVYEVPEGCNLWRDGMGSDDRFEDQDSDSADNSGSPVSEARPVHLSRGCLDKNISVEELCYHFSYSNAKVCYVSARGLLISRDNAAYFADLRHSDIVLINTGLHQNREVYLRRTLLTFKSVLKDMWPDRQSMPMFVWRTSSAQHFPGQPGGMWPTVSKGNAQYLNVTLWPGGKFRCKNRDYFDMKEHNWRNYAARELLHELGFPVMDVWNITAGLAEFHPQTLNGGIKADCTHWCPNPGGLLDIWIRLLLDMLIVTVRDKADDKGTIEGREVGGRSEGIL